MPSIIYHIHLACKTVPQHKPSIMDAPYVDFFARQDGPDAAPMGSATKNLSGFTGHFGFFMFNTINFLYLVLFEWYAFRRLPQNNLLRLTFCAVVMQLVSCYSSITRFNVCVESFFLYGGFSTYLINCQLPTDLTYISCTFLTD